MHLTDKQIDEIMLIEVVAEIKWLLKNKQTKEARELYDQHKEKLDEFFENQKFKSCKWHEYTWYNKLFLVLFSKPWKYGTFKQWQEEWYRVKKWAKWNQIFVPIMKKDEEWKEHIRFMKSVYVFHEDNVEKNPEQE